MFGTGFAVFNDGIIQGAVMAPDDAGWLKIFVLGLYAVVLFVLWLFGVHRYTIMATYARYKKNAPQALAPFAEADLPVVTVQLAVFNEMYVVRRLLDAVCSIDYPRDKLEIQVLDDSTDETVEICRAHVAKWADKGFDISHIHRSNRNGYKAGALDEGLKICRGEFIVMFDADFVPTKDFIRRQVHHFSDPKVGFVQARWAHLNENHSLLTKLQALFLNGHFVLEHTARHRSGRFFTFSGTAGTWRKATIADAGGWEHDTLVEDCDLSYRCQLKGWKGVYLVDQAVPAELPVDMNGFKSQQHRWAKGFIQAMLKLLGPVWKSSQPLKVKIEATFHLCNNLTYPLMVLLSILMMPALYYRSQMLTGWWAIFFDVSLFVGATVSILSFYTYSERQINSRWYQRLHYMPLLMAIGIGLCLSQSKAVFEALFGHESPFVRTPKYLAGEHDKDAWKAKKYKARRSMMPMLELFFAAYFFMVLLYAVWQGLWMAVPFLFLFFWGFGYVGYKSVVQARPTLATASVSAETA